MGAQEGSHPGGQGVAFGLGHGVKQPGMVGCILATSRLVTERP